MTISELKGQPALERKPSSGPILRSRNRVSASAVSKVRPAGDFPKPKPQSGAPPLPAPAQPPRLAKAEAARRCAVLAGAGIAAVVFLDHAGAVRARRLQRGVVAGDGVAVV